MPPFPFHERPSPPLMESFAHMTLRISEELLIWMRFHFGGHLLWCTSASSILLAIVSWILHPRSDILLENSWWRWPGGKAFIGRVIWPSMQVQFGFECLIPFVSFISQQSLLVKLKWKPFHYKITSKQAIFMFPTESSSLDHVSGRCMGTLSMWKRLHAWEGRQEFSLL